ncbi:MAG: prenyltransferase [Bellilinea sp.]|nr:prenyltransferase [Bellilinea sp.]
MQKNFRKVVGEFIRTSQPLALLAGALLYACGVGVVVYLGEAVDWTVYWLGQAVVTLLQLSSVYLKSYYDLLSEIPRRSIADNGRMDDWKPISRNIYLLAAATTLTVGAMTTFILYSQGVLQPASLIFLGISWLIAFFYGVPPLRLVYSGYGELISAIFLTTLVPGFGYLLQRGELIPIMGLFNFPLLALFLALTLATSLETYFSEIKAGRQNMMIRLGWQRGMNLHNLLIGLAFLLVGISPLAGLAWSLTWPRLLVLPVGIFQIFQMVQIANGAKPNWRLLRLTAVASFGLLLYLQVFSLWTG